MDLTYDYHLHSDFSADSDAPAVSVIEQAIRLGLKGICFTEHMDPDYPPEDGLDFSIDFDTYFSTLEELQYKYQDRIRICIGMEFGIQPHLGKTLEELADRYPFDCIIASQHLVGGADPYYPAFFEGRTEQECYHQYFQEELTSLKCISSYDYDTLGHMDYIVRYGPDRNRNYSYAAYGDRIDPILRHLITEGKCLELNTGGLKYGLGEPNPAADVLKRYRELGGELITVGSDAHKPEHLAYDFDAAAAILTELGFRYYTTFQKRKPEMIRL